MHKTTQCVSHHSFESEFCFIRTQNDNLGDSLRYLNAVCHFTVCMWPYSVTKGLFQINIVLTSTLTTARTP